MKMRTMWMETEVKIFAQHPLKQQCCICTTLVKTSLDHLDTAFGKQLVPILGAG